MKNTPKYLSIFCTLQKLGTALFFCLGVWLECILPVISATV